MAGGGYPCALGERRAAQGSGLGVGAAAVAAPGRDLRLPWDRRARDFLAGRSVLCTSVCREGLLPPEQSPHSPRRRSVFAGQQLHDNAECQHCDGGRHRQPAPDDQRLGDRGGGRRGRGRCSFLGLQPVRRSLHPGDTRERDAVVRVHSRCEENRAELLRAFAEVEGFLGDGCLRAENAARRVEISSPGWTFGGTCCLQGEACPGCPIPPAGARPAPVTSQAQPCFPRNWGSTSAALQHHSWLVWIPGGPSWTQSHPCRQCPAPGRTYTPLHRRGRGVSGERGGWPHARERCLAGGFGARVQLLRRGLGHSCAVLSLEEGMRWV